jgi:steroid delta-isomerase-like uncharacterized protein
LTQEEPNKATYRRFVEEVINKGNVDIVEELYTPDYVDHSAPPGAPGGLDGVRAVPKMFRGAFPDVHFQIDEMLAEGDRVATRVTGHGTNTGPFMGRPPSGNAATWGSKGVFRVTNAKIAEHWGAPDLLALLSQIGALPPGAVAPSADTSGLTARPDSPPGEAADASLAARNKAVVRRVYDDVVSGGDVAVLDDIVAADHIDHPSARSFEMPAGGPAAIRREVEVFRTGFPDLTATVEDLIAQGNSVAARTTWRGTNSGSFAGIPPTGKPIAIQTIDFFRIGSDGRIVERSGSFDALGIMQQLGLVPPPGGPPEGPH